MFVGDLLHTPLQIIEPDANSCFCEDPAESRATRRKLLGWAADNNALVIPAHLGGHGAAEVVRDGDKFAIKGWARLRPVQLSRPDAPEESTTVISPPPTPS